MKEEIRVITRGECKPAGLWPVTLRPAVAALKQVLVTQLMSQEAAEQSKRSTGGRLLRTTSLRTPVDSRARVMVHNGSDKSSSQTEDPAQDLGSGDTGFFDSPEDYGESLSAVSSQPWV